MPDIYTFHCSQCDFSMPSGWGGYMYALNENGEKIVCPHPGENVTAASVLGLIDKETGDFPFTLPKDEKILNLFKEKTGFNSHCVCLDCLNQFDLDIEKDQKKCPECNSSNIKTELEMVKQKCPKCNKGIIEEKYTGITA